MVFEKSLQYQTLRTQHSKVMWMLLKGVSGIVLVSSEKVYDIWFIFIWNLDYPERFWSHKNKMNEVSKYNQNLNKRLMIPIISST